MANLTTRNDIFRTPFFGARWEEPFTFFDSFFTRPEQTLTTVTATNTKAQIKELDEAFEIKLAAPGLKKQDFNVKVNDRNGRDVLTVSFDTDTETTAGFTHGSFQRSWALPHTTDTTAVTAAYRTGILTVTVPKTTPVSEAETTITVE